LIARSKRKDGKPRKDADELVSVSYHRGTLINARSLFTFSIDEMHWLRDNPLAKVKGLGKRKSGKRKPTGNELRAWYRYTMAQIRTGDRTALGLMMAFSMALRSGDLTRRLVREVDMDCTQLNVEDGKTEKSNEARLIPVKLQPYVRQLVEGRAPFEPLFPLKRKGQLLHHTRRWLEEAQETCCAKAGVPYFCPHTLKGVSGTVLAKRGAAANVIMDHLSHEEDGTTFRHYVDKSLVQAEQAAQVFDLFSGEES
jgi:integrase